MTDLSAFSLQDTIELLSGMSSLTVTVQERAPAVTVFHCKMVEKGLLGGEEDLPIK